MRVAELWRYPVKSMGGERLDAAVLTSHGVHADRLWAVRDLERGETTTGRRIAAPLRCTARYATEPGPGAGPGNAPEDLVTFPDGTERSSADAAGMRAALTELCGKPVELTPLPAAGDTKLHRARLQTPGTLRRDLGIPAEERLPNATIVPLRKLLGLVRWTTPPGTFFDLYPLLVMSREGLAAMAAAAPGTGFEVPRFRPNVLVEGASSGDVPARSGGQGDPEAPGHREAAPGWEAVPEFGWAGGTLAAASGAAIGVEIPAVRCVVPTREQPGLSRDPQVMRTVAEETGRFLGVYCDVGRGGELRVGDELALTMPAPPGPIRRAARTAAVKAVGAGQRLIPGA